MGHKPFPFLVVEDGDAHAPGEDHRHAIAGSSCFNNELAAGVALPRALLGPKDRLAFGQTGEGRKTSQEGRVLFLLFGRGLEHRKARKLRNAIGQRPQVIVCIGQRGAPVVPFFLVLLSSTRHDGPPSRLSTAV